MAYDNIPITGICNKKTIYWHCW